MRLPKMFGLLAVSALLIGANSANALELTIDDLGFGTGIDVTIDDSGSPGIVDFTGAVGVFDLVVSTGLGAPLVGDVGEAEIDLSARATSDFAGTIEIALTDTDLTIEAVQNGGTIVTSDLGINSVTNASATIASFIRINPTSDSDPFELLAVTTDVDLLETVRRTINDGDVFDLRTVITMVHGDKFSFASAQGNINVAPIPLPAALPLFLTALLGLGFVGRHRRRQAA